MGARRAIYDRGVFKSGNYSANSAAITLAPIKGRLCGAKRGGDNNYGDSGRIAMS